MRLHGPISRNPARGEKENSMIKRTYRLLLIVIMSGMMAACCCVYTSSGTLLMDPTAGALDTDAAVPSASR